MTQIQEASTLSATTGSLIEKIVDLREQAKSLEDAARELRKQKEEIEYEVLNRLEADGVDKTVIGKISVSRSRKSLPQVKDWEQVYQFIRDNDAFHLLHKRITVGAFEEAVAALGSVPGIEPHYEDVLSVRKTT